MFKTLLKGAIYAILVPSGEILGLTLSGFPKSTSRGIREVFDLLDILKLSFY
jgi:hypothetical protein